MFPAKHQYSVILGLNKITAERFIEKLRSNITPVSEALYAELETENAQLKAEKPDLALTLAGEERCVRVINRTVISEMVGRLQ